MGAAQLHLGSEAEGIGHLLEGEQQAENLAAGGRQFPELVELAFEQTAQGGDAGRRPVGEVGQGKVLDHAAFGGRIRPRPS